MSAKEADRFFDNALRNTENFDVVLNCRIIDSINQSFSNGKTIKAMVKYDLCAGDCCTSYKKLTDPERNSVFCFSKSDCSEYGFSNDQYYLVRDTLSVVRHYTFGIDEWPTDSSETIWGIEEKIFLFNSNGVLVKERKKRSVKMDDFNLGRVIFKETHHEKKQEILIEKTKEYNELLELQDHSGD
ncbi:MAG: hypothetical protein V4635_04110 [Bacteroidota bacterium]